MSRPARLAAFLPLILGLAAAGAPRAGAAQPPSGAAEAGGVSGGVAHPAPPGASGATGVGETESQRASQQDRELDRMGRKLLAETPRNPPNDDAATGGSLRPH